MLSIMFSCFFIKNNKRTWFMTQSNSTNRIVLKLFVDLVYNVIFVLCHLKNFNFLLIGLLRIALWAFLFTFFLTIFAFVSNEGILNCRGKLRFFLKLHKGSSFVFGFMLPIIAVTLHKEILGFDMKIN